MDESPDFTPNQKGAIKNDLEKVIKSFEKHLAAADAQIRKSPWVQSTELSDNIAKKSRRRDAICHSIEKTISCFNARKFSDAAKNLENILTKIQDNFLKDDLDQPIRCQKDDRYRTVNGSCNNLRHKSLGAAGTALSRLVPPAYADGQYMKSSIVFWGFFCKKFVLGRFVPRTSPVSPRQISNKILKHTGSSTPLTKKGVQHMTMQFGQFLSHDISLTPEAGSKLK